MNLVRDDFKYSNGYYIYDLETGNRFHGVYITCEKTPSYPHIMKNLKQIVLKSKYSSGNLKELKFNRYKVVLKDTNSNLIDTLISYIKEEGGQKGNNTSWLTPLMNLRDDKFGPKIKEYNHKSDFRNTRDYTLEFQPPTSFRNLMNEITANNNVEL